MLVLYRHIKTSLFDTDTLQGEKGFWFKSDRYVQYRYYNIRAKLCQLPPRTSWWETREWSKYFIRIYIYKYEGYLAQEYFQYLHRPFMWVHQNETSIWNSVSTSDEVGSFPDSWKSAFQSFFWFVFHYASCLLSGSWPKKAQPRPPPEKKRCNCGRLVARDVTPSPRSECKAHHYEWKKHSTFKWRLKLLHN